MTEVVSLEAKLSLDSKGYKKGLIQASKGLDKTAKATDSLGTEAAGAGDKLAELGKDGKAAFDGMGDAADNAKGGIGDMFSSISGGPAGIAAAAIGAVVVAVVAIGAAVAEAAGEYNQGMRLMQAQTGKTGDELDALGATALDVYVDTFGASITDATNAVSQVTQVLGETDDALKTSAKNALVFQSVFDVSIPESLRAVRSATEAFGTTSTQTFDQMAATIQRVGDPADDLADTINEYSADFAQAGFSSEQMFGILEAGVRNGARNFDVMADAVREFTIRIIDGSETTKDGLELLFRTVGQGGQEFFKLKDRAVALEEAIKSNAKALKDSEGAYKTQQAVVKGLQSELAQAKRELDALAQPNLAGFDQFDDKLFDLEQQSKRVRLALLDIEPETDVFESTQAQLDQINTEMDRLSLQRSLAFDEQFRALEKAAEAGTEKVISFGQAMSEIAQKKEEIAGIEGSLSLALIDEETAGNQVALIQAQGDAIKSELAGITTQIEQTADPTQALLDSIASGGKSAADAFFEVSQMLSGVDDKLTQEQIGVALFGTKFEELGTIITTAATEGQVGLESFAGTMDRVAQATEDTSFTGMFESFKKEALAAILQSESFASFMESLSGLADTLIQAFAVLSDNLKRVSIAMGGTGEGVDVISVAFAALEGIVGIAVAGIQAVAVVSALAATAFSTLAGVIVGVGNAVSMAGSLFSQLGQIANLVFGGIMSGIQGVINFIGGAIGAIASFGDRLASLAGAIPDWLIPGSPPPLANALKDIKAGLNAMPAIDATFGSTAPAVSNALQSPVGGGGGGGSSSVTVNIDGVSATSVTNDDPGTDAIRMTIEMLTKALGAA